MTLVIESHPIPTLVLAIIYFFLTLYGCRQLIKLHHLSPELNTKKLFVMNCLLTSLLRFLSFSTMSGLSYFEYDLTISTYGTGDDDVNHSIESFYEKSSIVLLDLPDFCFISAYVLLLIVWAEAILSSRRHWLSSISFRRSWLLGYVLFNTILYALQVSLYALLFFPAIDQNVLSELIYLTLTGINLGLPFLWLFVYLYLAIRFSGFPFVSVEAQERATSLSRLGSFWTLTRIAWGIVALTTVLEDWLDSAKTQETAYAVVLVSVFLLSEIIPIILGYQTSTLSTLSSEGKPREGASNPVTSEVVYSPLLTADDSHSPGGGALPGSIIKEHSSYSNISSPGTRISSGGNSNQVHRRAGAGGGAGSGGGGGAPSDTSMSGGGALTRSNSQNSVMSDGDGLGELDEETRSRSLSKTRQPVWQPQSKWGAWLGF